MWTVSTTTTAPPPRQPSGLLIQTGQDGAPGHVNLTELGAGTGNTQVTATNASDMLSAVNQALAAVKTYAASIGSAQDPMTSANNSTRRVSTDYTNGVSALVDADMNTASTRLQALQTKSSSASSRCRSPTRTASSSSSCSTADCSLGRRSNGGGVASQTRGPKARAFFLIRRRRAARSSSRKRAAALKGCDGQARIAGPPKIYNEPESDAQPLSLVVRVLLQAVAEVALGIDRDRSRADA